MARGIIAGRTARGPGRRVYRVDVSSSNRRKLKALHTDIMLALQLGLEIPRKTLLRYKEEMKAMLKNLYMMSKKRTRLKMPPVILPVRFIMMDGQKRGDKNAPCVVDLQKGELRIPSYDIVVPLRKNIIKALNEENNLNPRPTFVVQVTRRGHLKIIATRSVHAELALPLRIITIDENSKYGFTLAVWDVSTNNVVLSYFEKLKPENHGHRRELAGYLQSYSTRPAEEAKKQLSEFLPEKILKSLTTEKAKELARAARIKERRLNDEFIRKMVAKIRKYIRERKRGTVTLILIDPIDAESLIGTELQGTLLRARKYLQNLATYEGALLRFVRASGKLCPRCNNEGIKIIHTKNSRIFQCSKCGLKWERDKIVHYAMIKNFFARMKKEECDDYSTMAQRVLSELEKWLDRYQNLLIY